jgi:uncharacterized membrane protein YbhN (UPF0104 family)
VYGRRTANVSFGTAVGQVIDAAETFFDHLTAVDWVMLGIAVGFHVARLVIRAFAWRNIIKAAYPETRVPWWSVFGSYMAGIGVNSIVPVRGGDVLKLYLIKHRVEGSTYPTLTATLLVETIFVDTIVAGAILAWAFSSSLLPSLDVVRVEFPQIDWSWPLNHPKAATVIAIVWAVFLAVLVVIAVRRWKSFRARVRQGFAILRPPRRFVTGVVLWQLLSWVLRGASVWFFLEAFRLPATVENTALVLAVQSISTLLPFTPGGAGTQQGLLVYAFRDVAAKTVVLSFSVGMFLTVTIVNVVLGFACIFAMLGTLRWRRVVEPEEEQAKAYAREA